MRAVIFDAPGGPEALHLGEYPVPTLSDKQLLVRVAYTALNRADTLQRKGLYPPPPGASEVLGLELSGVVYKIGHGCSPEWQEGDRVAALVPGGSYAEYCVVEEPLALKVPPSLPLKVAASLPEAYYTAYQLLFFVAHVKAGDRVLIHAGASGVGLAAIQLVREVGAIPYVTASADKHRYTAEAGAEVSIDYKQGPWLEALQTATGGQGVHVVLDCIGAPYYAQNVEALCVDGVYVLYGFMAGFEATLDMRAVLRKRITIAGTTLRARSLQYKADLTQALWTPERTAKFVNGRLKSFIHCTLDWARAGEAHAIMERNENVGKIVLAVDASLE